MKQVDKVTLQTHLNDPAKRLSEVRRTGQARALLLEGDLRGGHRPGLRNEESGSKTGFAEATPASGPNHPELGSAAIRAGIGFAPGSRPAKARYDRNLSPQRVICSCGGMVSIWTDARSKSHTAYRGKLRDFGKTQKALRTVHLPEGLVNELWLWKQECSDHSPGAFIFPNARKRNGAEMNGFIRTDNYPTRVLTKLATELGLPKLNFQVLRRTMARHAHSAQTKGGVKDVQGVLGHSKADTTVNVYMQSIEASVKQTLDAIYSELTTPEMRAELWGLPST